ncbi:MAG: hypothetical protein ACUVSZ_09635 [Chloroflexus sp.]|uniref:hypothetical protein n=1 Tax=Chloroflexus sp. TaxID=1904827 RepID=UPI00404B9F89
MKNRLLEEQGMDDEDVAADRTGCSPGPAGRYDLTRTGRRSQRWAKGVDAVGLRSPFILAWHSGWGPGSDGKDLPGLRRDNCRDGRSRAGRRRGS